MLGWCNSMLNPINLCNQVSSCGIKLNQCWQLSKEIKVDLDQWITLKIQDTTQTKLSSMPEIILHRHLMDKKLFNTLRPRQNGHHFPDDIFKWIILNENVWISIDISLKFVPRGPINNIPTLVQVMAWRRLGDKSLSEPMMVRLPMHIYVTRPQWVNYSDITKRSLHLNHQ